MNKLTIIKGNEEYDILVSNYKFLYGNNEDTKFDIARTLERYFKKIKPSEYGEEYHNIPIVKLNDKEINTKNNLFFHVHKNYLLSADFKLTTTSLILRYLETLLSNDLFVDTINTINILFESLSQEIADQSVMAGSFTTMVPKQLLKLFSPLYLDDDFFKDEYDLSISEIILLQLKMIKYIAENNKKIERVYVYLEVPYLTSEIIDNIKIDNTIILISSNDTFFDLDMSNYYICERKCFDLASETDVYENICDNGFALLDLKEGMSYMKEYLFNKSGHNVDFIKKIIK
jgi:hypothetical protein